MPKIAIIDDDELFIESWKLILKEYEVVEFSSPDDFKERSGDLSSYEIIITDYYFENGTGKDVAAYVEKNSITHAVVVCSNNVSKLGNSFDRCIDKQPLDDVEIRKLIDEVKR